MTDEPPNIEETIEETPTLTIEQLAERVRELEAKLAECELRIGEHSHDGYASAEHGHPGSDTTTIEEVTITPESRPEPAHPYFRRVF